MQTTDLVALLTSNCLPFEEENKIRTELIRRVNDKYNVTFSRVLVRR